MTATGMSAEDLIRLWLEAGRAFSGGSGDGAGQAWQRAEALFSGWTGFAEAFAEEAARRDRGPGASPFDPAGWMRPPGEGGMADLWRWLEGPDFADLFAEERRLVAESREWAAFTAALEQYRGVIGQGWLAAFRAFAEAVLERGEAARAEGRAPPGWDETVALWRGIADAEMGRTYRSDAFLTAQRQLVEAWLALRERVRARIERFSELLGIPTRREVDDLHETVAELRREIRALRRGGASP